jgi:pimeloyl-ACP methyl ester carboxylesterase
MKNRINGHELGLEVLRGKGPSLLLIHGLGLDRSIWREMAENISAATR